MRRVTLDTSNVSTIAELHEALRRQLDLPDYYGQNLDALWDCLTGWIDLPLTVEWRGYHAARVEIGEPVDRVLATLRMAESELDGFHVIIAS